MLLPPVLRPGAGIEPYGNVVAAGCVVTERIASPTADLLVPVVLLLESACLPTAMLFPAGVVDDASAVPPDCGVIPGIAGVERMPPDCGVSAAGADVGVERSSIRWRYYCSRWYWNGARKLRRRCYYTRWCWR